MTYLTLAQRQALADQNMAPHADKIVLIIAEPVLDVPVVLEWITVVSASELPLADSPEWVLRAIANGTMFKKGDTYQSLPCYQH